MHRHGYHLLWMPAAEHAEPSDQRLGKASDVVFKEMYTFADRGCQTGQVTVQTLRSETAGTVAMVGSSIARWCRAHLAETAPAARPEDSRVAIARLQLGRPTQALHKRPSRSSRGAVDV